MEVLARRLNLLRRDNSFSFHPKCKKINLTHLMFADDVLVFSKADRQSLSVIKSALMDFQNWSGLAVSFDKSSINFGGSNRENLSLLASAVGIPIGTLPFKYLGNGIPIDSRSLKKSLYNQLADRMTTRVQGCEAKKLSYVGRLVLVRHVLSAIALYWMRVVMIPQGVLKKINSVCRSYLWEGKAASRKALIAWKLVCKDFSEGGLGIKNLGAFNTALNLSQVWNICLNKDNIWTRWLHSYFIQNSNFWEMQEKNHYSWQLKKLLKLREKARLCVTSGVDGTQTWRNFSRQFSVSGTYKLLIGEGQRQPWVKLIWSKLSAPKHSLCSWLAIQNRLLTKDRMSWLPIADRGCCWCIGHEESNAHIFFHCTNMQVLKPLLARLDRFFIGDSWELLLEWRKQEHWRNKEEKELTSFTINAAIYEIWRSRNSFIFQGSWRSSSQIINHVWHSLLLKIHTMPSVASLIGSLIPLPTGM